MKKTVVEYITDTLEDIPKQSLQENRIRLNAFFSEQETIEKRDGRYIFRYAFYSVENPRRYTRQSLFRAYDRLPSELKSIHPGRISDMEYKDVVLYGEDSTPVAQKRLAEYLKENNGLKIQLSFNDNDVEGDCKGQQPTGYPELQKSLFFCKRKKCLLLFVSVRDLLSDLRFYDLLEEYRIDFRSIDFPWFCRENLQLIKAVMLYEKLPPESWKD